MTADTAAAPPRTGIRTRWRLRPAWRKAMLTVHTIAGVGWLGVHGGVLALLATGLAADDPARAASAYSAAAVLVSALVPPLFVLTLATGLVLALGTPWGLARHYWVLIKLGLTVVLIIGSTLSLGPQVLELAESTRGGAAAPALDRSRAVVAFSVSLCFLIAASALSTVKPFGRVRGRTRSRTAQIRTKR